MNNFLFLSLWVASVIDLGFTYIYVFEYRKWQPTKPYRLIEKNPILLMSWNVFGLTMGTLFGAAIFLVLEYAIVKYAHPVFGILLLVLILMAIFNTRKNIKLLGKLRNQYPNGHLPEQTFGKVEGNN